MLLGGRPTGGVCPAVCLSLALWPVFPRTEDLRPYRGRDRRAQRPPDTTLRHPVPRYPRRPRPRFREPEPSSPPPLPSSRAPRPSSRAAVRGGVRWAPQPCANPRTTRLARRRRGKKEPDCQPGLEQTRKQKQSCWRCSPSVCPPTCLFLSVNLHKQDSNAEWRPGSWLAPGCHQARA